MKRLYLFTLAMMMSISLFAQNVSKEWGVQLYTLRTMIGTPDQSGMVGFDAIFRNVHLSGAEHMIVEQETTEKNDMLESLKISMDYLLHFNAFNTRL